MLKRSRRDRVLLLLNERARLQAGIRGGLLYSLVSSHFLQGILIEGTPFKDTVYVWRLCMPLYRPATHVTLNFSQRLSHANHQEYFEGDEAKIASSIDLAMTTSAGSYDEIFSHPMSIESFRKRHIDAIEWDAKGHMPGRMFEAGATFAVSGNFQRAEPCFQRCLVAFPPSFAPTFPMWQASKDYLEAMAVGQDAVMQLVARLEAATRLALRLDQLEPLPGAR